jgi:hypothetical protein
VFCTYNGTGQSTWAETDIQGDAEVTVWIGIALNLLERASDRLHLVFDHSGDEIERGCHRCVRNRLQTGRSGSEPRQGKVSLSLSFLTSSRPTLEPISVVLNRYRVLSWGRGAGA